jgi:hypothetical protein
LLATIEVVLAAYRQQPTGNHGSILSAYRQHFADNHRSPPCCISVQATSCWQPWSHPFQSIGNPLLVNIESSFQQKGSTLLPIIGVILTRYWQNSASNQRRYQEHQSKKSCTKVPVQSSPLVYSNKLIYILVHQPCLTPPPPF